MKALKPFIFSLCLFPAFTLGQDTSGAPATTLSPEDQATIAEAKKTEDAAERKKGEMIKQDEGRIAFNRNFSNLSAADQKTYARSLQEANTYFRQKRIFEAIDKVKETQAIIKDGPDALNLLGACYVEFRDFDRAREYFQRSVELSPDSPSVRFNLCEIEFVTRNWDKCIKQADLVLEKLPESSISMRSLVLYKKILSFIKLDRMDDVAELAKAYTDSDDTPFAYYVDAALAFHKEQALEADRALSRARRVFQNSPNMIAPWDDTLIEYGYLQSFFGTLEEELDK